MATFHRRSTVTVDGVTVEVDVQQERTPRSQPPSRCYDVTVRGFGYNGALYGRVHLVAPDKVMKQAEAFARRVVAAAVEEARKPQTYLRVEGLPGYASDEVPSAGLVRAAYHGMGERPVTVFRVTSSGFDTARFVEQVQGRNFTDAEELAGGTRDFGPAEVTVTTDPTVAVDGFRWHGAEDGVLALALDAAPDSD